MSLLRQGKAEVLTIYLGEADQWHGTSLAVALVQFFREQGCAGATVWRGIEGFGPEHHLSTERLPEIAENLPVVIEIVERVEQIERFLPLLDEMVPQGMIIVSDVRIVRNGGA